MKKNKLYQFIRHELNHSNFALRTSTDNHAYATYELSPHRLQTIHSGENQYYHIASHHISFYEKYDDNDANVSFYHYTAYLKNAENEDYKLHVYFNKQGQISKEPALLLNTDAQLVKKPINPKLRDTLKQLAIDYTLRPIADLYLQFHQKTSELEEQYIELERNLVTLSRDITQNGTAYKTCLEQAIILAERLSDYEDGNQYRAIALFLRRIDATLQMSISVAPIDNNSPEIMTEVKPVTSTALIQTGFVKKISLQEVMDKALAAQSRYKAIAKASLRERLSVFLDLHHLCIDAQTSSEENNHLNIQQLQTIQVLVSYIQQEGKELISALLLKGEYDGALRLREYLKPIQVKLAQYALTTGNARLLDFLLTFGNVAIDTLTVKDKLSAVEYCLLKHTETQSKLACLCVLIKHNASVMVKVANGLPVAHYILSDASHPLRAAFIENADRTVGRQRFINGLINSVNNYLQQDGIDEAEKLKLSEDILYYRIAFTGAKKRAGVFEKLANSEKVVESYMSQLPAEYDAIDEDVLSNELYLIFMQSLENYVKKLSPNQQRIQANENKNTVEALCQSMLSTDTLGAADVVKRIQTILKDCTKYVDIQCELYDLQDEMSRLMTGRRSSSKLENEQRRMIAEIKRYQEKYPFLKSAGAAPENNEAAILLKEKFEKATTKAETKKHSKDEALEEASNDNSSYRLR